MNKNLKFYLTFFIIFIGGFVILYSLKNTTKEELLEEVLEEAIAVTFADVATEVGVSEPINSLRKQLNPELASLVHFGAGWGNLTDDACLDLYVANPGGENKLYKSDCSGGFNEIGKQAGVAFEGVSHSIGFGDIENDGCLDIYLANENEANVLYRNNCDGTFTDVTKSSGTAGSGGIPGSVSWVDFDNDGLLDIFVANATSKSDSKVEGEKNSWKLIVISGENNLYKNNGDGTFTDVAKIAGIAGIEKRIVYSTENEKKSLEISGVSLSSAWFQYNDDLCIDLIIASDIGISPLYKNNCDGTFTDITFEEGMETFLYGMGLALKDINNDSKQDIFISNGPTDVLFMSKKIGFEEVANTIGLTEDVHRIGWGTSLFDYDNDGDYDLYVVSGGIFTDEGLENHNMFYKNNNGMFVENTEEANLINTSQSIGLATADYDNDGDIDLYVTNTTKENNLYQNTSNNNNHWLSLRLRGTTSNSLGIGAKIKLKTGGRALYDQVMGGLSYASQSDYAVHFGLGQNTSIDKIEIYWPSGIIQIINNVTIDQELLIIEQ